MAVQAARTEAELDELREQLDAEVSAREADAKKADDALRNALSQAEKATQDRRSTLDLFEHVQDKVQKLEAEKAGKSDLDKRPMSLDRNKDSYAHFCTKWIEHFPKFDPYRSETEIRYWEDYWSNIEQFKRVTNCEDYMLAYLIKDTAPKNGDLDICLDELSHVCLLYTSPSPRDRG